MSSLPAAALASRLLTTKGNAQPSRGLAQPAAERPALMAADAVTLVRAVQVLANAPRAPLPGQSRVTVRVDDEERLRRGSPLRISARAAKRS